MIAIIASLIAVSVVQHWSIREYKSVIKQYQQEIERYSHLDTLMGVELDSLGLSSYRILLDEEGNELSYRELADKVKNLQRLVFKKDFVILKAKQYYRFDYRLKDHGDMITIEIWDKVPPQPDSIKQD